MNKNTFIKQITIALGTLCVILGIIGIFVPLLPTTPFLLLAASLYLRSSPKLYKKLISNKIIGIYIYNYINNKSISKTSKIISLITLWLTISFSAFYFTSNIFIKILLFTIATGVSIHVLSLKSTRKSENRKTIREYKYLIKSLPVVLFFIMIFSFNKSYPKEITQIANNNEVGTINLCVKGFKNTEGNVIISLYNTKETFLDLSSAYKTITKTITDTNMCFTIKNISIGKYAASIIHDENKDGEMEQWLYIGPPKEGVGTSQKIAGFPSYNKSKFILDKNGISITIQVKYIGE